LLEVKEIATSSLLVKEVKVSLAKVSITLSPLTSAIAVISGDRALAKKLTLSGVIPGRIAFGLGSTK